MSKVSRLADSHHSHDSDAGAAAQHAPGKRARTDELDGGAAVQRKAAAPAVQLRAGDWAMSDGMIAAMGLGDGAAPAVQLRAAGSGPHRAVQADGGALAGEAPSVAATAERGVAGASAELPHADAIQQAFGKHDVSGVRAQVGGEAADASKQLGAQAYATGDRVAFAQAPDLHTAAHEAAHVVQQAAGVHLKDGLGQVGDSYEQHADAVADAVVAGKSAEGLLDGFATPAKAAAGGEVQRKEVQLLASEYKTHTQIKAMTLSQFDLYANAQADWATSTTLGADKESLRQMLAFARKNDKQVLGPCGSFNVLALMLLAIGQGTNNDVHLAAYARAAGSKNTGTVHIDVPALNVQQALDWGAALVKLHAAIPGTILERVIPQNGSYEGLDVLVTLNFVGDFVKYYTDVKPLLDAETGMEVLSFVRFRQQGGMGKYAGYKGSLPEIRNYHRFTVLQLDTIVLNKARALTNKGLPRAQQLPICAILQTSLDHNGAFHQDAHLSEVLDRMTHITLVAEGKSSLAAFSAELVNFATFGKDGKVDEVMVNGHGSSKSMELAGDKDIGYRRDNNEEVYYTSAKEGVTVNNDNRYATDAMRAETNTFIQSIKSVLRDDPSARIVLNACLTASNSIDGVALDADPDTAARQIREAIAANPSLATAMKTKLGAHQGQVRGSNSSYGREATLVDGAGNIDIFSPVKDPELTNPDKLVYAELGTEPTGVLRATLEAWGTHRVNTIAALNRRIIANGGDTSWREKVILSVMKVIVANPDNAALISSFIGTVSALGHLTNRADCKVATLKGKVPDAHLNAVFDELATSATWTAPDESFVPAVVYQVWLEKNNGKAGAFLGFLNASTLNTQNARAFFDLTHLQPLLPLLMTGASATPPRGPFLIALLYMVAQGDLAPASVTKYIKDVVGVGLQAFPATCNIADILKSGDQQSVLEDAGVVAKAGLPPVVAMGAIAPAARNPNLDPTHAGNNTLVVDSLTTTCATYGLTKTSAYMLPAGTKIGEIDKGTTLNVVGKTRGNKKGFFGDSPNTEFFAVEHTIGTNQTVFVAVADVRVS